MVSTTKSVEVQINNSNGETVFSQQLRIYHKIKGSYGCQNECKKLNLIPYTPFYGAMLQAAYNIKTIVCGLSKLAVEKMIEDGWLHCTACRHAFHPDICPGKKRKFCPCCTTRLKSLKTVLKESTVKKIQNTILIHRMGDD